MYIARVEGTVVATAKAPSLVGYKLLLVRSTDGGPLQVAADRTRQTGIGDVVACVTSRDASLVFDPPCPPCDLAITGFVDEYNLELPDGGRPS
ncbi:MAG: ethanolamine utilization protein EutN [Synergistaceae bacterium]|jgi:microcompartment protein CcmK/EutM|nr:ethanolamine utilization protein EutN [Synergistaceae bacterium]